MTRLQFWQQKIVQTFHDPPGKPFHMVPGGGGHERLARKLFGRLFRGRVGLRFWRPPPDFLAAGADRPVLDLPKIPDVKGKPVRPGVRFTDEGCNRIMHPLTPHVAVVLDYPRSSPLRPESDDASVNAHSEILPAEEADFEQLQNAELQTIDALTRERDADWSDADSLRRIYWAVWRRWRDDMQWLAATDIYGNEAPRFRSPLWAWMPADTRCPDHSIWEHLRITSAACFVAGRRQPHREPWLLTVSISPVQAFISEARSTRDLWMGSFMLSDLVFHAMLPVIRRYGPDAIVYPDLRGNPRLDSWIKGQHELNGVLPGILKDPASYSSTIPDSFTAIIPLGAASSAEDEMHLVPLSALAKQCQEAVQDRWRELAHVVYDWLARQPKFEGASGWQEVWGRQCGTSPIRATWTAVSWEKSNPPVPTVGGAFPFQDPRRPPKLNERARRALAAREARFVPFIDASTLGAYDWARSVYSKTEPQYLKSERGFDYPLIHHELRARHKLRMHAPTYPRIDDERGEKCTTCRSRAVVVPTIATVDAATPTIDARLDAVRNVWKALDEDGSGRERLCAVCTVRRFLIAASGNHVNGFNALWAGLDGVTGTEPRVPFPSTGTLAAQKFLADVAREAGLADERARVVAEHRRLERAHGPKQSFTSFPRSLARLADVETDDQFLWLDTQTSIFPEAGDGRADLARSRGEEDEAEAWGAVADAVRALRAKANQLHIHAPKKRFAVLRIDGDKLQELLLGVPERIPARWRDVIHPKYVPMMEAEDKLRDAGWATLLDGKRLMGPSLHAFVTRALGEFAHRIAPWVVEQEFGGRLVYVGGDDLLAARGGSS